MHGYYFTHRAKIYLPLISRIFTNLSSFIYVTVLNFAQPIRVYLRPIFIRANSWRFVGEISLRRILALVNPHDLIDALVPIDLGLNRLARCCA